MHILKWLIIVLALLEGGWLLFDGTRAFVVGDYLTPSTGTRAGQLGPWSRIVSTLGFDPRGTYIKSLHVILGLAWLVSLICFVMRLSAGWWMLLFCAVGSLWYLPIGTVVSIIQIVLLVLSQYRSLP